MKHFFVLAICAFVTAGCITAGTEVDQKQVSAFQKGVTTYSQVIQELGTPNANALANDGSRTIVYTYTKVTPRAQDFIPYVGMLIAKADSDTHTYTFGFDRNGVLQSIQTNASQATAGYGLTN